MSPPSSSCPACGYVLDSFDKICPRCKGLGLPESAPAVANAPVVASAALSQPLSVPPPPAVPSFDVAGARTRPRWVMPVAGVLAALLVMVFLGYRYWISTPQYSLLQAKGAFEAHDLGTFEKYVAIDACADALTDDIFAEVLAKSRAQTASSPNPFGDAGQKMAEGIMLLLKPAISTALKTSTRELVSTGQISPLVPGKSSPVDLEEIKNNITKEGLRFDGLGNVNVENNTVTVELRFHNAKKNSKQPIELEMRPVEGYWQVARWKNAAEWMKQNSGTTTSTP